mgnify:CR=1 FL=1
MKYLISLFIIFNLQSIAAATEIIMQEFEYYSQTGGGNIINCGLEYDGITVVDKEGKAEFVNGSINLSAFYEKGFLGVMLKSKLQDINVHTKARQIKSLKHIWFGDSNNKILTKDYEYFPSDDGYSFVSASLSNDDAVSNYFMFQNDLIRKGFSIGIQESDRYIDKVFNFKPVAQVEEMQNFLNCSAEMTISFEKYVSENF